MSTEQNKAILRRWLEGWDTRSLSVMETLANELFTADFIVHDNAQPAVVVGPEGMRQYVRGSLKNMPDVHIAIEDMIAERDRVSSRFTVSGTDASIGKPVCKLTIAIYRFAGDRIAELWILGVPAVETAASAAVSEVYDPVAVVKAFDAACNAGDIEGVMAFFTDDAVLKDPVEPKIHRRKQQIREWFVPQMGHFQVAASDHRVTGNTVTWRGTLTGDIVRQMGSEAIEEAAEAVVQGGKITSFALTIVGSGGVT